MEQKGGSHEIASPVLSTNDIEDDLHLTPLQQRMMSLVDHLLGKHYLLDLDLLRRECIRTMQDVRRDELHWAVDDMIRRKILVHGTALTRHTVLDNENRNRMLALIRQEPGIYFSRIKEALNKEPRTVQWHLKMLLKFEFIREVKIDNNVIYFDFLQDPKRDRLHHLLHKDGIPSILIHVLARPGVTLVQLMGLLHVPRSTVISSLDEIGH